MHTFKLGLSLAATNILPLTIGKGVVAGGGGGSQIYQMSHVLSFFCNALNQFTALSYCLE